MAGARHIAAHVRLKGFVPDPRTIEQDPSLDSSVEPEGNEPIPQSDPAALAQAFNESPEVIALEYMKHGDMNQLLRKIGDRNLKLKSEELWRIFHCCKSP